MLTLDWRVSDCNAVVTSLVNIMWLYDRWSPTSCQWYVETLMTASLRSHQETLVIDGLSSDACWTLPAFPFRSFWHLTCVLWCMSLWIQWSNSSHLLPSSLPVSGPVWHLRTDLYFSYPLRYVIPSCPVWTSGPSSVWSTSNKYSITYCCVVDLVNLSYVMSTLELSWQLDVGCMFVDSESVSVYDGKEYC